MASQVLLPTVATLFFSLSPFTCFPLYIPSTIFSSIPAFPCPLIVYFNHPRNTQYWIKTLHLLFISPATAKFCWRNSYHSVLTPLQIHFPVSRAPRLPGKPICPALTHSPILPLFQNSHKFLQTLLYPVIMATLVFSFYKAF